MADLDKKIQKNQPDLVQSVLEAYEKRNVERVDILITNAFKQLKGSRFKPDMSICIGLLYLARIQPKIYSQSNSLKEFLKTHIKREGVPANIKGNKTDFFIPVLAANILLASGDSPDVRATILTRIGQWVSSNQKLNELVQHVLAMLCVRCHDDPVTVKTLIEMRHQWFEYLETNFDTYGRVSPELSQSIRTLLGSTITCEPFIENLTFLLKHDPDVAGLCLEISKFVVQRPMTFNSMLAKSEHSEKLMNILMSVFEAYFQQTSGDLKTTIKKGETGQLIMFNFQLDSKVLALDDIIVRALLVLISSDHSDCMPEVAHVHSFLDRWLTNAKASPNSSKIMFTDVSMATPYQLPFGLLSKMIMRVESPIHELAIYEATPAQLMELSLTFGLTIDTLNKIFERLDGLATGNLGKADIRDFIYFNEIIDHYSEIGVKHVDKLKDRLTGIDMVDQDCKNAQQPVEVKVKKEIT